MSVTILQMFVYEYLYTKQLCMKSEDNIIVTLHKDDYNNAKDKGN